MSIGYGGYAELQQSEENMVVYRYCCYNVNHDDYEHFMKIEDGELYISRDAFVEPEIHTRKKKKSSGRKILVKKRIAREVPIGDLLKTGKIKVKNASGTWKTTDSGIDIMALKILFKLFNEYQETGGLPNHISWFS